MILMGRESIDYNSGVVHGVVGGLLDMPSVSPVMQLEIVDNVAKMTREIEGGKEYIEIQLPVIAGCQEPIAEWKIANMRGIMSARTKPLIVIDPIEYEPKCQITKYENLPPKESVKLVPAENAEELIDLLKNEAKIL